MYRYSVNQKKFPNLSGIHINPLTKVVPLSKLLIRMMLLFDAKYLWKVDE